MRKFSTTLLLTISLIVSTILIAFSQGVVITTGIDVEAEPHESALFEVRSNNKGILIPKMTTLEREAIISPANGLLLFDEDQMSFLYYDSIANEGVGAWVRLMTNEQDLFELATKTALGDSTALVRSEIPDVSAFLTTETDPSVPPGTQVGEMKYWNGTTWSDVVPGNDGAILTLVNGVPTWRIHFQIGEVNNPSTGKTWLDRNLGASRVAISSTDADSYGDSYQWGRATDGHQLRTSGATFALSGHDVPGHGDFIIAPDDPFDWRSPQNDNLWQGVNGINNPCPSGYRLPTEAEWTAERATWSSNDAAGAFASWLKLPATGFRQASSGELINVGVRGYCWSSTIDGASARGLGFHETNAYPFTYRRAMGNSVRCMKHTDTEPTVTTTAVTSITTTSAVSGGNITDDGGPPVTARGIVWSTAQNPTVGINEGITSDGTGTGEFVGELTGLTPSTVYYVRAYATNSLGTSYGNQQTFTTLNEWEVYNPNTGKVWMDKNLGASQVATSSTDAASYGDLYQWGRETDGHQIRTSGTTATLSTTDTPGHGNFITNGSFPYDWRSGQNDNLWQGVSGTNNPCPSGYRLPTEAEWEAERTSWGSNDPTGAFGSPLKLPVAGQRGYNNGSLGNVGFIGYYWSSTVHGSDSRSLLFHSSGAAMYNILRAYGYSVRCIKD